MLPPMTTNRPCKRHFGTLVTRPATPAETLTGIQWGASDPSVITENICSRCQARI